MPQRKVKIAIVQFESEHFDTAAQTFNANLLKMRGFIADASEAKANVVVFNEYFLGAGNLSYSSLEGEFEEDLISWAKEFDIDVVAGTIVESATGAKDEPRYNTCLYVSRKGKVLARYRKKNLWHPEKEFLTASEDDHLAFETEHFKCGLLICWDMAWPEAFRELMQQGAEVIIIPTYWLATDITDVGMKHDPNGTAEASFLDSTVVTRAYENECVVVFVNAAGPKEKGFLGRSAVAMPFKGALCKMAHPNQDMQVVDVDLSILEDAKSVYQIHKDISKNLNGRKATP